MGFWNKNKQTNQGDEEIEVGDSVTNTHPNLNRYFKWGALRVTKITDGVKDSGGKFVYVDFGGKEIGLYGNAVKRVNKTK